jgi:hypothetical protein
MADLRITRLNPTTDRMEVPVRQGGRFVLGDPAHGEHKHHARHAVHVAALEEVLTLLERGYSLRMGGAGKRPSLLSRKSLTIMADGRSA